MPLELTQEFDFLVKNEFWVQKVIELNKSIEVSILWLKTSRFLFFLFFGFPWGRMAFPGFPGPKKMKNYNLNDLWMNTNLMCMSEKISSVLNNIKWKKIFIFNAGEEEYLLYKI